MIRVATALIALLSVLSTPIASAMCTVCCQRPVEHKLTVCRDKAHVQLGSHVDHMNHAHGVTQELVAQESDAKVSVRGCEHQWQSHHQSCQNAACLSAKLVPAPVASVLTHQLQHPSHLIATAIGSTFAISNPPGPPGLCRITSDSSKFASAPLRI